MRGRGEGEEGRGDLWSSEQAAHCLIVYWLEVGLGEGGGRPL
jgi:hypothetical protein